MATSPGGPARRGVTCRDTKLPFAERLAAIAAGLRKLEGPHIGGDGDDGAGTSTSTIATATRNREPSPTHTHCRSDNWTGWLARASDAATLRRGRATGVEADHLLDLFARTAARDSTRPQPPEGMRDVPHCRAVCRPAGVLNPTPAATYH